MINTKSGVAGRYRLSKCKADADGNPVEETREVCADWFDNLILDQGLDAIGGTRGPYYMTTYAMVGSGGTAPTASDTSMESFIASTTNGVEESFGNDQDGSGNWYCFRRETNRFGTGEAAGNLSEVGAGDGSNSSDVFSRALIRDSNGDPTTITVLSDEILDVTYELRIFPATVDATGTVSIGGETYDYTARASNVDSSSTNGGWRLYFNGASQAGGTAYAFDGTLGSITSSPSGDSDTNGIEQDGTYTPGSYQASGTFIWGLDDGNLAAGIRSVRLQMGWGTWQIEFSNQTDGSTIPKDNTKELTLTTTHSWARV